MTMTTRPIALAGLLLAALSAAASDTLLDGPLLQRPAVLRHFMASGDISNEKVHGTWQLAGQQAIVRGAQLELTDFTMTLQEKDRSSLHITSPACHFDKTDFEIKSSAPVQITSRGLEITGIGYDVYLRDRQTLIVVRDTVRIRFNNRFVREIQDRSRKKNQGSSGS